MLLPMVSAAVYRKRPIEYAIGTQQLSEGVIGCVVKIADSIRKIDSRVLVWPKNARKKCLEKFEDLVLQ